MQQCIAQNISAILFREISEQSDIIMFHHKTRLVFDEAPFSKRELFITVIIRPDFNDKALSG
jgi:hypothetical protein